MSESKSDNAEPPVLYELRGPAAWITLNRPAAHNALSADVVAGIADGLRQAEADRNARVVILAGNGPSFCAGADLKMVLARDPDGAGARQLSGFLRSVSELCTAITRHPLPVLAAVHGNVVAGGFELMLACDLVLASEDAAIGDGHARYGMFPGGGGAIRLPRKLGSNRAKYLLFTAASWDAVRMRDCGVVNEVVPANELRARVQELAEQLATHSAAGLAAMKRVVEQGLDQPLEQALALELAECERYAAGSGDFDEGLRAFVERRAPRFSGR
ncbi:enoyl-CoA hydratase [Prauserella sp. PE36]|uniref:Enoyl-CoA hydratase/isomerase family protein n=1 Tax=Prauserella endophytica TaxID=1592324 RepID=A0ABY2RV67_9PSEU|nr:MULTISPECIES: enoyl-CoA hydratase/isomerase family protein [Prauserella]RBM18780.1 enoyl-CoA hydratase [Prauserella sp. PE36]TKG61863.1 enoyl-CoA hydratase/isomerase family protein [Prauserella endophytica]